MFYFIVLKPDWIICINVYWLINRLVNFHLLLLYKVILNHIHSLCSFSRVGLCRAILFQYILLHLHCPVLKMTYQFGFFLFRFHSCIVPEGHLFDLSSFDIFLDDWSQCLTCCAWSTFWFGTHTFASSRFDSLIFK